MNIEILLTEAEIADEFAEAMTARDLPEKFFYWTPLSIRAWRDITAAMQPSLTGTWHILASKAAELLKGFPGRIPVISYGAGEGVRDRLLFKALLAAGRDVKYFPVDASQTMLETACAGAEDDDCEALGIKADISSPVHLMLAADVSEPPRLFLLAGNTLGGFDPMDQIRHVGECLRKGDMLILDARIHSEPAGEPSVEEKRFSFAPLASAGIHMEDGELRFVEKRDERKEGLFLLARRFQADRDLTLLASGREVHVERGERIVLNFRFSFTREALRWLVSEEGGLRIVGEIPSSDDQFITLICIK